ncbi:DUF4349 domain-containing protein [Streptomyces sp. NBC_01262]|uniref:DUF4349 domain-containing protein n=1 Tax=Streptomyces sp. NBC_01262 TaxID=2903803 RepID=UPI002E357A8D|nr:DUF4349 domain-containing protein [Streptomyces sp. NBC_01262]
MNSPISTAGRRSLAGLAVTLLAASLAVAGCGSGSSNDSAASSARDGAAAGDAKAPEAASGSGSGTSGSNSGSSKTTDLATSYIVRTATLTVEAKNVGDALAKARALTTGAGGYVGDESTSLDEEGLEHSRVELKVPADGYDQVLGDLADLGKLTDRKVNAQDVTSQVVDVQSRVKSQQVSIARLRLLMGKATKLSDVVTLESELTSRESDLEALEAQQASLKERTSMATITLVLTEPTAVAAPKKKDDGVWASVGHALGAGWHAFYATFRAILIALAAVLPFAALAAACWLVWRTLRRRTPAPPAPEPVAVPAAVGTRTGTGTEED